MLFKKMCEECINIKGVKRIKTTEEFFTILEEIKKSLLESGNYEYVGGNSPEETIKRWPQDGLWHRIRCKSCGTYFTLWYDTFGGKGYFKKGK